LQCEKAVFTLVGIFFNPRLNNLSDLQSDSDQFQNVKSIGQKTKKEFMLAAVGLNLADFFQNL